MRLEPPHYLTQDVSLLPLKIISGIYFLCRGEQIVYIGASDNILRSLYSPDIDTSAWDRAYYQHVHPAEQSRVLNELICQYDPQYNATPCKQKDAA